MNSNLKFREDWESILSFTDTMITKSNNSCNNISNCTFNDYIVDIVTRTTYLKKKFLGKGGFASCYELLDLTTSNVYAGKIIPKQSIPTPIHKEKIRREVELHRTLNHPHIVKFHHYFEDKTNVYILLENCPKKSLVHVLKKRGILTEPEVRYYMKQLVEGVQYIHSQRVVHRDLKLGNMFLTEDMQVKIGDFGLATRLDKDGDQKITVCGTPNYIAPEVLNRLGHDYQADIWALGCIMYAMLVGKPPFETKSLKETYDRITNNRYCLPVSLSQSAQNLIVDLLSPEPQYRPALDTVLQREFFQEFCPLSLSPSAYDSEPDFSKENELNISKLADNFIFINLQSPGSTEEVYKPGKSSKLSFRCKKEIKTILNDKHDIRLVPYKSLSKTSSRNSIYNILCLCIEAMPQSSANPPSVVHKEVLYVTKWIDYSNKYGFGFQLSDHNVGVLFNDNTKINLGIDKTTIHYYDVENQVINFSTNEIPSGLEKATLLLRYFAQYMDENLIEGGNLDGPIDMNNNKTEIYFMKLWIRHSKSIVMLLSNNTVQVNFYHDHTKIIITPMLDEDDAFVTYINEDRMCVAYRMSELAVYGCNNSIHKRLLYLRSILKGVPGVDC